MTGSVERLRARQEIIELLSSRAIASDDHDVERMVASHTIDGTDDHGDGTSTARSFIENIASTRYSDPANGPQKHVVANVLIDFRSAEEAFVESYHLAYHRLGVTSIPTDDIVGGRYLDVLKRVDGVWLIDERTVVYDWSRGMEARDDVPPHRPSTVRARTHSSIDKEMNTMERDAQLSELVDKQMITEVLYTRARAADRRDHALALSCYHPGATEVHEGFDTSAEDFLLEKSLYAPGRDAPSYALVHMVTNILIDFQDADEAFVESYHLCLMSGGSADDESDSMIGGRYLDTFRRQGGQWRISRREVIFDWSRTEPATRRFWDNNPNKDLISFGRLGGDDPLYQYADRSPAVERVAE